MISSHENKTQKEFGRGKWSKTEHDRFIKAVQKFGKDWVIVQKFVKTRTLTQVRSHAQKVFQKLSDQDIQELMTAKQNLETHFDKLDLENQTSEKPHFTPLVANQNKNEKLMTNKQPCLVSIFMKAFQQQQKEMIKEKSQKQDQQSKNSQNNCVNIGYVSNVQATPLENEQNDSNHQDKLSNCHNLIQDIKNFTINLTICLDLSKPTNIN